MKITVDGVYLARVEIDYGADPEGDALIVDNNDALCEATDGWLSSDKLSNQVGDDYLAIDADFQSDSVVWFSPVQTPGWYSVWINHSGENNNFCRDALYRVTAGNGNHLCAVDLRRGSKWHLLGIFPFTGSQGEKVALNGECNGKFLYADAVRFLPVDSLKATKAFHPRNSSTKKSQIAARKPRTLVPLFSEYRNQHESAEVYDLHGRRIVPRTAKKDIDVPGIVIMRPF